MYLLDTNICIFAIKKKSEILLHRIKENSKLEIFISALTIAELEFGIEKSLQKDNNRIALIKFVSIFNILPFDDQDAISYGKLKAQLVKAGKIIGPIDMLLAGQAISKNLILVTNNTNEFQRVSNLHIEDWTLENA